MKENGICWRTAVLALLNCHSDVLTAYKTIRAIAADRGFFAAVVTARATAANSRSSAGRESLVVPAADLVGLPDATSRACAIMSDEYRTLAAT